MGTWISERSPAKWRLALRVATFRDAPFHIETGSRLSGRRIAMHEYPKRDQPYAEDMGKRTIQFDLTGYFIEGDRRLGLDYRTGRDRLRDALEVEGPGLLIHPTMPELMVVCERYSMSENRERGGYVTFEMRFIEYGRPANQIAFTNTAGAVNSAVSATSAQSATTFANTMARFGVLTP
jgi:prophage DNA circulation protein